MERRKALAIAATVTCVLGSTTVAFASVGGVSLLGFGGSDPSAFTASATAGYESPSGAPVEAETRDVYDRVVVEGTTTDTVARGAEPPASTATPGVTVPQLSAVPPAIETRRGATRRHHHASTPPAGEQPSRVQTPSSASTTTTEPDTETTIPFADPPSTTTTTTTLPPVTTTTRPPGVPKDWPPGKPIPPMPPNCRHGELEDNGVWNCGDD